jgi:hypothetical protein
MVLLMLSRLCRQNKEKLTVSTKESGKQSKEPDNDED